MDERNPSSSPDQRGSRFGGFHRRTYEMELLLSGAVIYSLIRLPPLLNQFFASNLAALSGELHIAGSLTQTYFLLVVNGLIGAFVVHLFLRAFWIGLLGLESVFPEGIRWSELKDGPATRTRFREGIGSLAASVNRIDDLCSLVFSFAFFIVFNFIYSMIVIIVGALVSTLWSLVNGPDSGAYLVFGIVIGLSLALQIVPGVIDKIFSPRVSPDGPVAHLISWLVRAAWTFSPLRLTGSSQLTLMTNLSGSAVLVVFLGGFLILGFVQIGGSLAGTGIVRLDSLSYFPDTLREQGLDPHHYRSLRPQGAPNPMTPSVQRELIDEPYLKLFLPYYPRRHNKMLAEQCAEFRTISSEGLDIGRPDAPADNTIEDAASCLGSLFHISLDGQPCSDLHFDFTVEPETGLEGIISFISVRELAPGRHELEVLAPPRRYLREADTIRHLIPFWI